MIDVAETTVQRSVLCHGHVAVGCAVADVEPQLPWLVCAAWHLDNMHGVVEVPPGVPPAVHGLPGCLLLLCHLFLQ